MNYGQLKTDIKSFMEHDSTEFVAALPAIIRLAEDMIYQRLPTLPVYRQKWELFLRDDPFLQFIRNGKVVFSDATTPPPVPVRTIRSVRVVTIGRMVEANEEDIVLQKRTDSFLREMYSRNLEPDIEATNAVKYYAIENKGELFLAPILRFPDAFILVLEIEYTAPTPSLTGGADDATNWFTDEAYNLLFRGAMFQAASFLKMATQKEQYKLEFEEEVGNYQFEVSRDWQPEDGSPAQFGGV